MLISAQIITILFTFCGFCYTFGGKTQMDRSNGSKVTAAGLIALAILAAWGA